MHVSIDPRRMADALPIILNILHQDNAPTCSLQIQTKSSLNRSHQIGKEVAIIFSKDAEQKNSELIQKLLEELVHNLINYKIPPEKGLVLTEATMDQIEKSNQDQEKKNLECGQFDREITGSRGYLHYRCEDCEILSNTDILKETQDFVVGHNPMQARKMCDLPGVLQLAKSRKDLAHNPLQLKDDPFKDMKLK